MKKIYIIGVSCSGKSTLGKHFSNKYNISFYDLDDFFWNPNWTPSPLEQFEARVNQILQGESWIIAGNYSSIQDQIIKKSDTIVWLDLPKSKVFLRAVKRTLKRVLQRKSCCNGNYESLKTQFFSKDSLFLWILKTYPLYKTRYERVFHDKTYTDKKLLWLKQSDLAAVYGTN